MNKHLFNFSVRSFLRFSEGAKRAHLLFSLPSVASGSLQASFSNAALDSHLALSLSIIRISMDKLLDDPAQVRALSASLHTLQSCLDQLATHVHRAHENADTSARLLDGWAALFRDASRGAQAMR